MLRLSYIYLLLLIFISTTLATNVALKSLNQEGVDSVTAELITERIRLELFRTNQFRVMERNEMESVLKEQEISASGLCNEMSCDVELGRLLSVEKVITGSVGKIDSLYILSLRLINVETAQIEQVADVDVEGSLQKLFSVAIPSLVNELIGVEEVTLISDIETDFVEDESQDIEKNGAYKVSYRQRLKDLEAEKNPVKSKDDNATKRKVIIKGPNIIAGVATIGTLIAGVKFAEAAEESAERADLALKKGDLITYGVEDNEARKQSVIRNVLFGVSGISLVSFVISF